MTRRASTPCVGWVVDAQVDFMRPDGRLYVKDLEDPSDPGATTIVPDLVRAVEWMREHCDVLVFTGDWHGPEDEEIDPVSPDPTKGTYPPHCMGRSADPAEREGAEVIEEIRPEAPLALPIDADAETARRTATEAVRTRRPVFIHKKRFDVFAGNPATDEFLAALADELGARPELYVAGVARDVCVTQAVDGMLARGYPVTALEDATWGLGLEPVEATLRRWRESGGRVSTVGALGGA